MIILDIMMPPGGYSNMEQTIGGRFTGAVLLKDIRSIRPNIPVVVVSAHRVSDVSGMLGPVYAFLEKPVNSQKLIRNLLDAAARNND